jgi:hypothetical protein
MEFYEGKIIKHIGDGKFQVCMEDGEIKNAGSNLCGMIRYTYFEDYTLPEIGWEITWSKLMSDYMPKMQNDVLIGKIKPNQINY